MTVDESWASHSDAASSASLVPRDSPACGLLVRYIHRGVGRYLLHLVDPQRAPSEIVFESPDPSLNSARFEVLATRQTEFEASYEGPLEWQELPGRKATRIAEYLPDADVSMKADWGRCLEWLLDRQTRLRDALTAIGGVPKHMPPAASHPRA